MDQGVFGVHLDRVLQLELPDIQYVIFDTLYFLLIDNIVLYVHSENVFRNDCADPAEVQEVFDYKQGKEKESNPEEGDHVHVFGYLTPPNIQNADNTETYCHAILDDLIRLGYHSHNVNMTQHSKSEIFRATTGQHKYQDVNEKVHNIRCKHAQAYCTNRIKIRIIFPKVLGRK